MRLINIFLTILLAAATVVIGLTIVQATHQKFFPVVSGMEYTFETTLEGYVVSINFTKNDRTNSCEFIGAQTFVGERGGRSFAVPNEFSTVVGSRPNGTYTINGWLIKTREPFASIYADVIHKCNPVYNVRSRFIN